MSSAKLAAASGLAALALSACGNSAKPVAGTIPPTATTAGHAAVDDPRTAKTNHVTCLRQKNLPVTPVGNVSIQIGTLPAGPTVVFEPTPGAAQFDQMSGKVKSAEVIGSALLYPNQASDQELKQIEDCLASGVVG
jgi:hypothetical protein